jgi:hypothetical protein
MREECVENFKNIFVNDKLITNVRKNKPLHNQENPSKRKISHSKAH